MAEACSILTDGWFECGKCKLKQTMVHLPICKLIAIARGQEIWSVMKGTNKFDIAIAFERLLAEIPGETNTHDVAHSKLFVCMFELNS